VYPAALAQRRCRARHLGCGDRLRQPPPRHGRHRSSRGLGRRADAGRRGGSGGPQPQRGALLPAVAGDRSAAWQPARELRTVRRHRRHLRAHRRCAWRVEGSRRNRGSGARRAGAERRAVAGTACRAQRDGRQRPARASRRRNRALGRAHAGGRRRGLFQIRSGAPARIVHRVEHHRRPAMGDVRAERTIALGAAAHESCRATRRSRRSSCAATPRP
jgi:hypothetical protein